MPIQEGGKFSPVDRIVSPGTFTRETDQSGIEQGVSNIGAVIVAPFPKGPAFSPTLVRSLTELQDKFGLSDGTFYGPYSAAEYLKENGLVTVCRVGALTGYKQNYPFAIWAVKGNYGRSLASGSFVPSSSIATVSYLSGSISSTNATGVSMTVPVANILFADDTANTVYKNTYQTIELTFTNWSASFGAAGSSGTIYERFSASVAANTFFASGSSVVVASSLASDVISMSTPWEMRSTTLAACGTPVLTLKGGISGSFGSYTGTFTPTGSAGTFDPCTNTWSNGSAAYEVKLLAVLADTQNATISDLVAPGFSGSVFTTASVSLTAIGTDFSVQLKSTNATTPYGTYQFSLDASNPKFITNVFGTDPTAGKVTVSGQKRESAYLYKYFKNAMSAVIADKNHWFISGSAIPIEGLTGESMDFTDAYSRDVENNDSAFAISNASTPWIISQAIAPWAGGSTNPSASVATRSRLFKVHTLTDGTNSNTSYKIEISNVKLAGNVAGSKWGTFTLTVRKYSDTDKKPTIYETFTNLNLDPDSSNYIARRIGDRYNYINASGKIVEFGTYSNNSSKIRIEMATTPWAISAVPAGFEQLAVPVNSSLGYWTPPVRYARASLYGVDPGKYASGIAFNNAPAGADAQLSSLYPVTTTGVGAADDNLQYFAPTPNSSGNRSVSRGYLFALDQPTTEWGYDAVTNAQYTTGSFLPASLSGSIPFDNVDPTREATYVRMRKFVVGFQGGFDGQSPAIPINVGSDISPGNTQGLDCVDISTAGSVAYRQCIGALSNADEWDINLIALPGICHQHHPYVTSLVVDMCENRGDCFYIMDLNVIPSTNSSVSQINDVVGYAASYDTNYAAAYYPWVKILDTNTNKIVAVPPSVVLPAVYAANDNVAAEWFAPAGLNRGGITQAIQVCDRTTHQERDTLYEGKVNPIAAFPGKSICVWGQKTLQIDDSALNRINVRRLMIKIKKFIASISNYLVFEQNVSVTRNKFLAIANPYFESIQQRSGLYAFYIKMDDENNTGDIIDRNILYGQIYIQPTKTAEFIIQDFSILPTGAQFPGA